MTDIHHQALLREIEVLQNRLTDLETQLQNEKLQQAESLENLAVQKKQLELINRTDLDIPQFLDQTLEQLIYSTGSKLGYIFLYDEVKQQFRLHSFSKAVMAECLIQQRNELYELSKVGLWGEAVRQRKEIIVNDYQGLNSMKKGYPTGHLPIYNFISIPVFSNGQIVAVVGAANKDSDYNEKNLLDLKILMNTIWPMVELRQQKEQHRQSEERYRLLYEASNKQKELLSTTISSAAEGIFVTNAQGSIILLNQMAESITGLSQEAVLGGKMEELFRPGDEMSLKYADITDRILKTGERISVTKPIRLLRKDDSDIYVTGTFAPFISDDQEVSGIVITIKDTSKEYLLENEMQGFLNVNLDMLCVLNLDGMFVKINKRFEQVLGYTAEEIEGKKFLLFVHPDDVETTLNALSALGAKEHFASFINRCRCQDGTYKYIEWNSLPGVGNLIYASARDVTEKKQYEEKLEILATKDELTGTYNRYYYDITVPKVMERSDRYNEPLSFLLIDLDHFKKVNDTYGHQIGDEVLKKTARIAERTLRDSDILFRFGGEEFLVLMPRTTLAGAAIAGEKLRAAIESNSFAVVGRQTVSVGVSERLKSESLKHWFRRTDEALYRAKQQGRNLVVAADGSEESALLTSLHVIWQHEWESGNEEIDQQHRAIIQTGNQLINASQEGVTRKELIEGLERLLSQMVSHFECEERIIALCGYPEYKLHASIHQGLVAKARHLQKSFENGELTPAAFFSFIVDDLIIGHLVEDDLKFFSYTSKQPIF